MSNSLSKLMTMPGVGITEIRILCEIASGTHPSQASIGRAIGAKPPNVSAAIKNLLKYGAIRETKDRGVYSLAGGFSAKNGAFIIASAKVAPRDPRQVDIEEAIAKAKRSESKKGES